MSGRPSPLKSPIKRGIAPGAQPFFPATLEITVGVVLAFCHVKVVAGRQALPPSQSVTLASWLRPVALPC